MVRGRPFCAAIALVERVTGIEPAFSAWEADVLPLNYTRTACCGSDHSSTAAIEDR